MRALPLALILCGTSLFAQMGRTEGPAPSDRSFTVGGQVYGPDLTGHFQGLQDGQPIFLDLDADLGLGKDKTTPGFFMDYQGAPVRVPGLQRFGGVPGGSDPQPHHHPERHHLQRGGPGPLPREAGQRGRHLDHQVPHLSRGVGGL